MNFALMWGCSFWLAFTGRETNPLAASGLKNLDGTFSGPPCPTSDSTKCAAFHDKLSRPRRRHDKLSAIHKVRDLWTHCLELLFSPDRDICVDEQLFLFRGRCNFKQYIPTKPAKYGLKIWTACDVKTSYAWRLQVYTGKAGDRVEVNQGMRVVLELTEGLQGNVITCDNFFTSFALAEELLRRKLALVGTIRKKKPELPPQLLQTRDRAVFSFAFTLTHIVVSYVPDAARMCYY